LNKSNGIICLVSNTWNNLWHIMNTQYTHTEWLRYVSCNLYTMIISICFFFFW
jgi:hypothetical protein